MRPKCAVRFLPQDSHFPPIGRVIMPRPSMCHTSSLQTPVDKEQALQISVSVGTVSLRAAFGLHPNNGDPLSFIPLQESDLLSLTRSLLQAWQDPLVVLSTSVKTLPHPAQNSISNKIQELQEHSKSLGSGLEILSGKVLYCPTVVGGAKK